MDTICEILEHYSNVSVEKILHNAGSYSHDYLFECRYRRADTGGRIISAPTVGMPSVSQIVGSMKRKASKRAGYSLWQKSLYEHIIRNDDDYLETVQYIENNPEKELLT